MLSEILKVVLLTAKEYEIWTPYDTPAAADILMQMLEEDRHQNE